MENLEGFNEFNEAVNKVVEGHFRALGEVINSNHEQINLKLNTIIEENKKQEIKLNSLDEKYHQLDKNLEVHKESLKPLFFVKKHPLKFAGLIFFLISIISHFDPITIVGNKPFELWKMIIKLF